MAQAEVATVLPDHPITVDVRPTLTFLRVEAPESAAADLVRLSTIQAVFVDTGDGGLRPVDADPGYTLPRAVVWGAKYRGKTHELVTQLAVGLALRTTRAPLGTGPAVLDPMAGRGTTLLWAARLGLDAWGVEQEPAAPDHLRAHIALQAKLHRFHHRVATGSVGSKRTRTPFLDAWLGESRLRLFSGDSRHVARMVGPTRFACIVADLPYGIQFKGKRQSRSPLSLVAECAPAWAEVLAPGGSMVLVWNRFLPKRPELVEAIASTGLTPLSFEVPHRMSASIHRDVVVFQRAL